jgi:hypothetical protein
LQIRYLWSLLSQRDEQLAFLLRYCSETLQVPPVFQPRWVLVAVKRVLLQWSASFCDGQPLSRRRQGCRALDFGSLIAKARHILAVHAPARAELAARFSHVMVDEFQVPEGTNSSAGRMRTNSSAGRLRTNSVSARVPRRRIRARRSSTSCRRSRRTGASPWSARPPSISRSDRCADAPPSDLRCAFRAPA